MATHIRQVHNAVSRHPGIASVLFIGLSSSLGQTFLFKDRPGDLGVCHLGTEMHVVVAAGPRPIVSSATSKGWDATHDVPSKELDIQ